MGIDARRGRQPQLRPGPGLLPERADPARRLPGAQRQRRLPEREDADRSGQPSTVFNFGHGVKLGIVGFTTESTPGIVFPGNLGPFEVRPVDPGGQRRGGEARQEGRRDRRARPRGCNRRDGHRPDRSAHRHRGRRPERRRRDRRPQRPPGRRAAPERRARHREPGQGHPLHADPDRGRARQGGRRLQDGRLPQAVDDRRHARRGDPGEDRRPERPARADPRHPDRRCDEGRSRAPTSAATATGRTCESLVGDVVTDAMRTTYAGSACSSRSRTRAASAPT